MGSCGKIIRLIIIELLNCGFRCQHGQFSVSLHWFHHLKTGRSGKSFFALKSSTFNIALISQTAGHCALAKADGHRLSSVRIGDFDSSKDPDCAESGFCAPAAVNHAVSHVVVHPDYVSGQYHHDIALLILRTPINYTVAAQPICLQRDRSNLVVAKRATIIGWGKVSLSNVRSPEMQFMDIPLASWDQCLRVYGTSGALESQKSIGEFGVEILKSLN